jgi:site-specific DNA-cytosine methylase
MDWAARVRRQWPRKGAAAAPVSLRVAPDCSGLGSAEAAVQALERVGCAASVRYMWAADWADASQWWLCNVTRIPREKIFGDMNQRVFLSGAMRNVNMDGKQVMTTREDGLDLYVCGFPCKPFSTKGKQLGFDDKAAGSLPRPSLLSGHGS